MSNFKELSSNFRSTITRIWRDRRPRERVLAVVGITALLIGASVSWVYDPIAFKFAEQAARKKQLAEDLQRLPEVVSSYLKVRAKKALLEAEFNKLEMKERNEVSYLDDLWKKTSGLGSDFDIQYTGKETPIGREYSEVPMTVKITTSNLSALMSFVRELVQGQQPMVLTDVSIDRVGITGRYSIDLRVSSIRKIKPGETREEP